ncbi:uncharacterized protein [Diadema setosum]|uniref:uncharacterized protein n=1 Tax=Diadema setosum TaxID=31175 RepID=UPI003B3A496E
MSSTRVFGVLPKLAEFGEAGSESDATPVPTGQPTPKIRVSRVSRGLTRSIRRPCEHSSLDTEPDVEYHQGSQPQPFQTSPDMIISTTHPRANQLHLPTIELDDDDDDEEFDDDFRTMCSTSQCETPIPPLPRARVPSRLGAASVQAPDIHEPNETGATEGMMLIGRPASTASYNRMHLPADEHKTGENVKALHLQSPPAADETKPFDPITSLEDDLKHLLFCQTMGIKIVTSARDFVPGTIAQLVFHCPRCLKHWKLSGKPQAPSKCNEPDEPTQGPEFEISSQSQKIMQELQKLPEDDKQQLINVLSRAGSPGADEELLDLVNSASSGFLRETSASPHASRRSRSPDKRSMIRLSRERDADKSSSPSPVNRIRHVSGLNVTLGKGMRSQSASTHQKTVAGPRQGVASAGSKYSEKNAETPTNGSFLKSSTHSDEKQRRDEKSNVIKEEDDVGPTQMREEAEGVLTTLSASTFGVPPASSVLQHTGMTQQETRGESSVSEQVLPRLIPQDERSSAGQSIVELQDIDGARYHGFLSSDGQFIPIAKLDKKGSRLPLAVRPDGTYCIIGKQKSQSFLTSVSSESTTSDEETCFGQSVTKIRDATGVTVKGYRYICGKFVPISRIDNDGNEEVVMMKPDGSCYVVKDGNSVQLGHYFGSPRAWDTAMSDHGVSLETGRVGQASSAHRHHGSRYASETTVMRTVAVTGHDQNTYQGFDSPGIGFVPTARVEPDGEKLPVVMNAEGQYTVVNKGGVVEVIDLRCYSDKLSGTVSKECSVCKLLAHDQPPSEITFQRRSSGALVIRNSHSDARRSKPRKPDTNDVFTVGSFADDLSKSPSPMKTGFPKGFHQLSLKRGFDGSLYHGRCHSNHFVPVFRLDEKGYRHPVLTDSVGRCFIIDSNGNNRYLDEDGTSDKESTVPQHNKIVVRDSSGFVYEGMNTIDGRFEPVARIDEGGSRQAIIKTKTGKYKFLDRDAKMKKIDVAELQQRGNQSAQQTPFNSSKDSTQRGEDGYMYEGDFDGTGQFIPTFRIDESGYRQVVLRNSKGQAYLLGIDGEIHLVPDFISSKAGVKEYADNLDSNKMPEENINREKSIRHENDPDHEPEHESEHRWIRKETSEDDSLSNIEDDLTAAGDPIITAEEQTQGSQGSFKSSRPLSNEKLIAVHDEKHERRKSEQGSIGRYGTLDSKPDSDIDELSSADATWENATVLPQDEALEDSNRSTKNESLAVQREQEKSNDIEVGLEQPLRRGRRESTITYLGIKDDSSKISPQLDENAAVIDLEKKKERRESAKKSEARGKSALSKQQPVKNTAVHNMTGKPERKGGQLQKHTFATPQANLANTLSIGQGGPSQKADTSVVGESSTPSQLTPENTNKLPTLSNAPQLPDIAANTPDQSKREVSPKQQSQEALLLPDISDRANTLPRSRRGRTKIVQKKLPSTNRRRAGRPLNYDEFEQRADGDNIREVEAADQITERSSSPLDLINKFSRFKLSAEQPLSPPPPPSGNQPTYRMMYSTLPNRIQSPPSPNFSTTVQNTSVDTAPIQKSSPAPDVNSKENCKEIVIPSVKLSSAHFERARPQSFVRSKTSMSIRPSSRALGIVENIPDSISLIWRKHYREVELLRQKFQLSLTNAFTFSMFELPEQYAEHNQNLMQQARQIRTLKKPTRLGKPPAIAKRQKRPQPLKKIQRSSLKQPRRVKA